MKVRLLDDLIINKIAAGEVVDRPSSVVKELVENALDAHADRIIVNIKNGGQDLIEVIDNGEGIHEDDIETAFLRHATSKINSESDLYSIGTLGFRGEALPSIAAVAKVEVNTCRENENGCRAFISGGEDFAKETFACPEGTRISIKDLFFNTPARKKFMKSAVSEGNHIYNLLCRYAFARPDVAFTYSNNSKIYFKTLGNGRIEDVVFTIWGPDYLDNLISIEYTGVNCRVSGLVSKPSLFNNNRRQQLFFVNKRPIRSPMLYRAIDEAYKGVLVSKQHPLVILHIEVPNDSVDVNIHPQKLEVRFQSEGQIFSAVNSVLKAKVSGGNYSPIIKGYNYGYGSQTNKTTTSWPETEIPLEIKAAEQNVENQMVFSFPAATKNEYSQVLDAKAGYSPTTRIETGFEPIILGQIMKTYILLSLDSELIIVDQHAAHERILYNRYIEIYENFGQVEQILAVPLDIRFNPIQYNWINNNLGLLSKMGWQLEQLERTDMILRGAPAFLKGQEREVLFSLCDIKGNDDVWNKSIVAMACKNALKAGSTLSTLEMQGLVKELFDQKDKNFCPHGRPSYISITRNDLDKFFKRKL